MHGAHDRLAGAPWSCGHTEPGAVEAPRDLESAGTEWLDASVPGTAAGALRDAGRWSWGSDDEDLLDGHDWWFRCHFEHPGREGPWELALDGLATLADVWLNGRQVLHSENMFLAHRVPVEALEPENELAIRFAALGPVLARRHPRPRWKSRLVRTQSLRWYRTTLLGRMPGWSRWAAPVGPWRAIRLLGAEDRSHCTRVDLQATCEPDGAGGSVTTRLTLRPSPARPQEVRLHAGDESVTLAIGEDGGELVAEGTIELDAVQRWWPHTHGPQPLYDVVLELDGAREPLRRVGFRTIEVDRADGGFRVSVNGVPIFCRGVVWTGPDAVSFAASTEQVREAVELARDAGMNMFRLAGYGAYEGDAFWDACDELGVLVWQDVMLASMDPPDDPEFVAKLEPELRQIYGALRSRPAFAIACGSTETYQQAAAFGLPRERYESSLIEQTIPAVLDQVIPGVPYVVSSPSGGDPPMSPNVGIVHYFGIGAYLRPATDARLAEVRFATECLAFAIPPERETVEEAFGGAGVAGHDPRWKQTVGYDAASSWDYEDVREYYVQEIFGVDPIKLRYSDPERALDLGRAVVAEMMGAAVTEWRRRSSSCDGALVLMRKDLWPGAGWGIIDSLERPKAPFYALRRVFSPTAVLITDEGLSGLWLHLFNDGPEPIGGTIRLRVFDDGGDEVETAEREIELDSHGALDLGAETLLDGFRDLGNAYRFAPRVYDVVLAELCDGGGVVIAQAYHLVDGPARPRLAEIGLAAQASRGDDGGWSLRVSSALFAQYVCVEVPGWRAGDSWFHLAPGASVTLALRSVGSAERPSGSVRALNCSRPAHIVVQAPA